MAAEMMTSDDRIAVMDLLCDYAFRLETGDLDGFIENFAPDGILEGVRGAHEGRDAIRTYVGHLIEIGQDGPDGNRHILGMPRISGDTERCRAQTYVVVPGEIRDDGISIKGISVLTDQLVKSGGRWRIQHRSIRPLLKKPEA